MTERTVSYLPLYLRTSGMQEMPGSGFRSWDSSFEQTVCAIYHVTIHLSRWLSEGYNIMTQHSLWIKYSLGSIHSAWVIVQPSFQLKGATAFLKYGASSPFSPMARFLCMPNTPRSYFVVSEIFWLDSYLALFYSHKTKCICPSLVLVCFFASSP